MKILKSVPVAMGGQLRLAVAASLIWIPLYVGESAQATAQTQAQEAAQGTEAQAALVVPVVPQQVRYAGKLANRAGDTVEAVFRIYAAQEGGDPLWTETQKITVGEDGSYTVVLGGASLGGLPQTVFAGGAARWLGVSLEGAQELDRAMLTSVPYAMKAADAEALAGHAAGDFVTQAQLAALGAPAGSPAPAFSPETGGMVTGSGTAGTVPLWTGALTQGNSEIVQVGSDIGIHEATPGATLDVGGTATIRGATTMEGTATLFPVAPANTTAGNRSQLLALSASAWSSTANAPVDQTFRLFSNPTGNNTATPSGVLYLQFLEGTTAANILSIASNGVIAFNSAQTFPGTIKSVSATSPVTASTTAGAVSLGLNTSALETTLNGVYAQLGAANTFTKPITFAPSQTFPITGTGGGTITGITTSSPLTGSGTTGSVALGLNTSALETTLNSKYAQLSGGNIFSSYLEAFQTAGPGNGAVLGWGTGGSAGTFGDSDTGYGLQGESTSGVGTYSLVTTAAEGSAGVLGVANTSSVTGAEFDIYSGVSGDTGTSSTSVAPAWAIGVLGTADDGHAGVFLNNSSGFSTLYVSNASTGGTGDSAGLFKTFMASSNEGTCGIGGGSLSCTGPIKGLVSASNGAHTVETYAVQSPENWMEDFGSAELKNGVSVVTIDLAFAQTVSSDNTYHVFITPNADSKGLYVIAKTATTFEVRESGGGTSSLTFDYRIVAKRRGFEQQRLVDVTERFNAEQARAMPAKGASAARAPRPERPSLGNPGKYGTAGTGATPGTHGPPPVLSRIHPADLKVGAGH